MNPHFRAVRRNESPVIVIGAGIAGLVCANMLLAAGMQPLVLEADDSVGGRVRTRTTRSGFRMDRGFQVLFSGYPALRRHVPVSLLSPRYFDSGIEIVVDGESLVLGHPLRDSRSLRATMQSGLVKPRDVVVMMRLLGTVPSSLDRPLRSAFTSVLERAERLGASPRFIDTVLRPLFGGISLDRNLSSDAAFLSFVLRSLLVGRVFLPTYGIGQVPGVLASRLPQSSVLYHARVDSIVFEDNNVRGVVVGAQTIPAHNVVIATEATEALQLSNVELPTGSRSCTTAYFGLGTSLTSSRRLILNAATTLVNHVVQLTNIAPEYAPRGEHLLSVTSLNILEGSDESVADAMLSDLRTWLPGIHNTNPELVGVVRVPYAQFEQRPGIYESLPSAATGVQGLFLGGEYLHSSSIQGAVRGGEMAAEAVLSSSH